MRNWLNNQPIHRKLWLFNLLTALVAGLISAALLIVIVWQVEIIAAQKDASIKAAIVAENVLPALQFRDAKTAREVLEGYRRDSSILGARIVEPNGKVFAEYASRQEPKNGSNGDSDRFVVNEAIQMDGERLATLELTSSTDQVYMQIMTYVGAVGVASLVSLLIGSYIVVRLQRAITNPLVQLSQLMREVSSGHDFTQRALVPSNDELGQLSESFNAMIEQIESRNIALNRELSERIRAEKQLEHLAHHDQVTGLPNRHYFRSLTADLMHGKALEHGSMALLFVDLDNFKYVNDTFGHEHGDLLLQAIAQRLSSSVRAHDTVVRFGGDEFVILLDRIVEADNALRLAHKLLDAVVQPLQLAEREYVVTCSIGISIAPEQAGNFDELLSKSDAAMYAAKSAGKNAIRLWEASISSDSSTRFVIESDLRQAIVSDALEMYYQAVVDLRDHRIIGMEALMRWHHPTRGFVSPTEFIPVAEDTGLILNMGVWAMKTAFTQGAAWNELFGPLFVAVNVSGRQFREHDFAQTAETIALASGLDRAMCELEVTESIIMGHTGEAAHTLQDLSARGFALSLDDFGTGYSSMSYLKRFSLDKLKIDRSFVKDLPEDQEDAAIAEAIIGLSRSLSMRTVAEGIETAAQARMLREMGCQYGQGYYFSKPLPAEAMAKLLEENQQKFGEVAAVRPSRPDAVRSNSTGPKQNCRPA